MSQPRNALKWLFALVLVPAGIALLIRTVVLPTIVQRTSTYTVTDMAGRTVSFSRIPERIALVRGRDIYELALLLGDEVESKVMAWGPDIRTADQDAYGLFTEHYPRLKNIPELGSIFQDAVSAEAMLALNPDLIVMDKMMLDRGYKCVERLESAGLPLIFLDMSSDPFSGPQQSLLLLGKVLGRQARAEEICAFVQKELNAVDLRLSTVRTPLPSVYLECGNTGVAAYGNTYGYDKTRTLASWGAVIKRARGENIAEAQVAAMAPISPEFLLSADPEVIVITGANWSACPDSLRLGCQATRNDAQHRLDGFVHRTGWNSLRAVRNRRIHGLFHGFCMHLHSFAALQQCAKWFYPEVFSDLPEERLESFNRQFLPICKGGTWMINWEPQP